MVLSCKAGIKILLEDIREGKDEIGSDFEDALTSAGLADAVSRYEELLNEIIVRLEVLRE